MKHYEKVTKEVTELVSTTCDLCGRPDDRWGHGIWQNEVAEGGHIISGDTTVEMSTSATFYECGASKSAEVDICPECFVGRLIPWLESQGAKVEITTTEW